LVAILVERTAVEYARPNQTDFTHLMPPLLKTPLAGHQLLDVGLALFAVATRQPFEHPNFQVQVYRCRLALAVIVRVHIRNGQKDDRGKD
jgi:hypothetical protein